MTYRQRPTVRRKFLVVLLRLIGETWPILSALVTFDLGLGAIIGVIERWGIWSGLYFGCITGLTIGYGDLVPTCPLTRILAVAIGACRIVVTGLVAALAVSALQQATAKTSDSDSQ